MNDSVLQELQLAQNPAEISAIVAESVFNSLPGATALVARHCVILHWFNKQIVEALLPESNSNQATEVYQQLESLPFIASVTYGLTYHDLTREGLLERYIIRQPGLLKDGAKRAASVYESHNNNLTVAAEAFFCHAVAGNLAAAIQWRDNLLTIATVRKDWQFYNNILQMQQEVEKLPFVEPLERFFAHDVFISYSVTDRDWVQNQLLPNLENQGLRIWVDFRNIELSDSFAAEIERAVQTSRKILLILSPDYVKNVWTQFEQSVLYKLEIFNWASRLIVLRKEKFAFPLFVLRKGKSIFPSPLNNLNYVDFAEPNNLNIARKQLLAALGKSTTSALQQIELPPKNWFIPHPYPMPPNFTGREVERQMLSQWLEHDRVHSLFILQALGGFGKSALSWYWLLRDVKREHWQRVVWWSFYETDAGFDSFLQKTLKYLSSDISDKGSIPVREQVDRLLNYLCQSRFLLILDGFERLLRVYGNMSAAYQGDEDGHIDNRDNARDCVNPMVEYFLNSLAKLTEIPGKVLMTTRLRPRVVEVSDDELLRGCKSEELKQMQPDDAVQFFLAQGVRGSHTEIKQAGEYYGFHPLSLCLLAGLIVQDAQQPGDIAAAARLDISGQLLQRQHHVLQQTYDSLTPERQKLLSQIACFRGSVTHENLGYKAAAQENNTLDADLQDLVSRGLLQHDQPNNRYDLHPIVRRYAYDRLGSNERSVVHGQLRDYFAAVPPPERVQSLDDLNPVIELYHHTVKAGQYDEAFELFCDRINHATYYQFGAYQLQIELLNALFLNPEEQLPRLKSESKQALALNELANNYGISGQPYKAIPAYKLAIQISEKLNDKHNLAIHLSNPTLIQLNLGELRAAETNLRRSIALCQETGDNSHKAWGHRILGTLLAYRGMWTETKAEFSTALAIFEKNRDIRRQGLTWADRGLTVLLLIRAITLPHLAEQITEQDTNPVATALMAAHRALELADETAHTQYLYVLNYVSTYWLLGAAHRVNGNIEESDRNLTEAITRCRAINLVFFEADILLELARLRLATEKPDEALRLAKEALTITERCGYVLQGADVHLFLAQLALADDDREKALSHAREARRLATCDGPPNYTYKVAYEEAGVLLEELGQGI
ncbi:MAG: toll/interleukin-1 receptor domain-containing protein [Nostoc sp.]|uniref:toll/interleukin-1 receptor domain-containing protein n=1 Tax=Nostoc sp. TaxID=1180 RepID=UPI002FF97507